ncbi:MAG TPA: WD40 repeat domain-containing protein [Anaerohalosphaeraceae bacterium]|nr:WD40 repeat domain-containing protein [Anaerohalosphaeraceae bacterium]
MKKQKSPVKLFAGVFAILIVVTILRHLLRPKSVQFSLDIRDNAGVALLETVGDSLVCVFSDGRTCIWDWNNLPSPKGDFRAVSCLAAVLDASRLAAVPEKGKKILTVYDLPAGRRQKELSVGWEDQSVFLRISPDKKVLLLMRKNPADSAGKILYEFAKLDIENELIGPAVTISISEKTDKIVDFAASSNQVIYAVGSKSQAGWVGAVDLHQGKIVQDIVYADTKEFCSAAVSPDGQYLLAGDRDGILYKIDAADLNILKKVNLLAPGETRPVTNDYSVLNLAFSNDGRYYVATINPKAYLLQTGSDTVFHWCTPTSNLTSKIAYSPDSRFFATSDIRASKPIRIWETPVSK